MPTFCTLPERQNCYGRNGSSDLSSSRYQVIYFTYCCLPLGRQHTILDIRCLLVPSPSTELCMCDEISILENFWMFVRSVAQYQYQAIVIYTRFSTEIDISLFAIYRSLRTVHHIFACLWKF